MSTVIHKASKVLAKLRGTKTVSKKIQRNDPCYCGSRLKFKHCHLKTHT